VLVEIVGLYGEVVGVGGDHQRFVLARRPLHLRREGGDLLDQVDLVLGQFGEGGRLRDEVRQRPGAFQETTGARVGVLDVGGRLTVQAQRLLRIEDEEAVIVAVEHPVEERARADLSRDERLTLLWHLRVLLVDHGARAREDLRRDVLVEDRLAAARAHRPFRQRHHLIAEVEALIGLGEAPEFHDLEDLLHIERLPRVDHPDRAVHAVTLELLLRQRQILGRVERGAIGAEDRQDAIGFLVQAELLIDLDDRQTLADLRDLLIQQFLDDRAPRLLDFALEEPDVEADAEFVVDPPELLHAPRLRLLPEADEGRIFALPLLPGFAVLALPRARRDPPIGVDIEALPLRQVRGGGHLVGDGADDARRLRLLAQLRADDLPQLRDAIGVVDLRQIERAAPAELAEQVGDVLTGGDLAPPELLDHPIRSGLERLILGAELVQEVDDLLPVGEALQALDVDLPEPAPLPFRGLLAEMESAITPQAGDDVLADVADVVGADHAEPGTLQDVAEGVTERGVAEVADVERLVGIRLRELDHHALVLRRALAVGRPFREHATHRLRGDRGGVEVDVDEAINRLDPIGGTDREQLRGQAFGDLLRLHVGDPGGALLGLFLLQVGGRGGDLGGGGGSGQRLGDRRGRAPRAGEGDAAQIDRTRLIA